MAKEFISKKAVEDEAGVLCWMLELRFVCDLFTLTKIRPMTCLISTLVGNCMWVGGQRNLQLGIGGQLVSINVGTR